MNEKVAVLLAAYNGVEWLREQLESILGQEYVDVTVYISVDKSSDGTEVLVDTMVKNDSRIRVLEHGKKFGGASGNFFRLVRDIDADAYDYFSFSDQDDIWFPNKLSRAIAKLRDVGAEGYSSNVVAFWPDGKTMFVNKAQLQRKWDFLFESAGPGCTFVMTKALMKNFRDNFHSNWNDLRGIELHDWLFYAFARARSYGWVIDPEPSMYYRQHTQNQFGVNSGALAIYGRFHRILNGWYLGQVVRIAALIGVAESRFVHQWRQGNRRGMIWLAFHARQCRRRTRDQIYFFFLMILYALIGRKEELSE